MLLTPWLNNFRMTRPQRNQRRGMAQAHPQLQQLEDRVLLAASIVEATPDLESGFVTAGETEISLTFSEDVNGADQASNYELIEAGADHAFGTADDTTIVLGASYADSVATLLFSALDEGRYRLTVTDAITDVAGGEALDGDGDSAGGGNYVREFIAEPVTRVGGEFQVNTYTLDDQQTIQDLPQSVAMDAAGNFVVTWTSSYQDGSVYGVYGQRFDDNGNTVGGEFQVNTTTGGYHLYSTVGMDAAGNFVVTWSSLNQDGSGYGIYGQRFDANGNTVGGESVFSN